MMNDDFPEPRNEDLLIRNTAYMEYGYEKSKSFTAIRHERLFKYQIRQNKGLFTSLCRHSYKMTAPYEIMIIRQSHNTHLSCSQ